MKTIYYLKMDRDSYEKILEVIQIEGNEITEKEESTFYDLYIYYITCWGEFKVLFCKDNGLSYSISATNTTWDNFLKGEW